MKGQPPAAAASTAKQRRWKWLALAVLLLVFFSMLVPLAFLLGLHNPFHNGHFSEDSLPSDSVQLSGDMDGFKGQNTSKEIVQNVAGVGHMQSTKMGTDNFGQKPNSQSMSSNHLLKSNVLIPNLKGLPNPQVPTRNTRADGRAEMKFADVSVYHDAEKSCQVEFGSYCLWSSQHKEAMKDTTVKRLKDQLFIARAYYPTIAKLQGWENLSRELKQDIQEHEHMLSEAISDAELPHFVGKKILKMEQTIAKAKGCDVECSNVERKLRQILDLTEDETHFHRKQSAFLYHLVVQTMSKSLHCLSMRLTVEYFQSPSLDPEVSHKFENPRFRHYVIFSRDTLAVSVTVNSTVMSSEDTTDMVFHLITDRQNYYAMKFQFARNLYKQAVIRVLNIEDFYPSNLNIGFSLLSPAEEFQISIRSYDQQIRTDYISIFGHSHFLLPEIFKNLKKVIVLDDDVIVQKDLSSLWSIDLEGKVNGAINYCGLQFGQHETYLGGNIHERSSCMWMSGLNIIDLEKWREHNISRLYLKQLERFQSGDEQTWRAAALPLCLISFEDHIFPLDNTIVVSGLGHDYNISAADIRNAVALHYNGNMKPWLDLAIPKYKKYWKKFLTQGELFMDECNVSH